MVTRHIGKALRVMVTVWGVSAVGCAMSRRAPHNSKAAVSPALPALVSLGDSLEPLIEWFNAEREKPRFVTILSSTCGACVAGAVAVNEALLKAFADTEISISVVWIDILPSDDVDSASRAAAIFDDPRVTQFHDPRQLAGQAFATGLLNRPPAWDMYLFYASGSTWTDSDPPKPTQWMHQLGFDAADEAHKRSGDGLSAGLYRAMVDLGMKPSLDSPPTKQHLAAARRRANATMAAAHLSETQGDSAGKGQCARCAGFMTIGQCSLAGWRYLVMRKAPGEGGNMIEFNGYPTRPETETCMKTTKRTTVLDVAGMTCPDCASKVAAGMLFVNGVQRVEVDYDAGRACVVIDPLGKVSHEQLVAAVRQGGYEAKVVNAHK